MATIIVAQEIRANNTPGGLARGGWLLNVIERETAQFVGYADYEDCRNFAQLRDYFPSFTLVYLGWVDVAVSQWQGLQYQRPGHGDTGHGHNGPLNRWDRVALAMIGS